MTFPKEYYGVTKKHIEFFKLKVGDVFKFHDKDVKRFEKMKPDENGFNVKSFCYPYPPDGDKCVVADGVYVIPINAGNWYKT